MVEASVLYVGMGPSHRHTENIYDLISQVSGSLYNIVACCHISSCLHCVNADMIHAHVIHIHVIHSLLFQADMGWGEIH